jgi:hypothetical protein
MSPKAEPIITQWNLKVAEPGPGTLSDQDRNQKKRSESKCDADDDVESFVTDFTILYL